MLSKLQKEWHYFLLALGFFTRMPVPSFANFQEADLNYSSKYFPLIGIIVGGVGALFYCLSAAFLPQTIAVLISMASTIYLTGAFHEDGLADSADGLGGGWKREQILTIMQDSRLGTYGAVALFLMLFTKFQLLTALDGSFIPFALVAGHTLSRLSAVWVMATLAYAKPDGKAKPLATQVSLPALVFANVVGVLPLVWLLVCKQDISQVSLQSLLTFTFVPMLLAWIWWRLKIKRWLGGYTGDALGAAQQITELAFYFGLLFWSLNA